MVYTITLMTVLQNSSFFCL